MKKTSVIFSSLIMVLALVVAVAGFSAAWFGDIKRLDNTVVVNSYAPIGNATVSATSTSDYVGASSLRPACINKDILYNDFDGSENYDSIDVLDGTGTLVSSGVLDYAATQVTVSFDFVYGGTADSGQSNKAIRVYLTSATLQNPRSDVYLTLAAYETKYSVTEEEINTALRYADSAGATQSATGGYVKDTVVNSALTKYDDEFDYEMGIGLYALASTFSSTAVYYTYSNNKYEKVTETLDATSFAQGEYYTVEKVSSSLTSNDNWYNVQNQNSLGIIAVPYTTAVFIVTINFAHIDEETDPALMSAQIFFNFQIEAMSRSNITG